MKLGVIGYGERIQYVISEIMSQDEQCRVTAIVDVREQEIRAELQAKGMQDVRIYATTEEMLASETLDGILIGTRCSKHTELALKVLPTGLPLFLEKPVSTTIEDLYRLKQGFEASNSQVVVSFPLRHSGIVTLVKEIIDSGKIGTVEHVQAVNNVPYGNVYYMNWYRDEQETGGLFLQKATHDFDYLNHVIALPPKDICAMTSKQIFKGTKPAGLKCKACDENRTCLESTAFEPEGSTRWEYCAFAEDTGNEDSGSALVRYASGMHLSYSQNFFARRGAQARGARFLGYKGTVDFDFYTGIVKVHMHHSPRVETYDLSAGQGHFGGDTELARNFVGIMRGEEVSTSPLDAGLLSALMCLKGRESAVTDTFQSLRWE
ncbi:oxidoreductase [Paenibacillus selenitireducens]|uniref:Oxidoreductase n=1 Tax=Paenibacillus selenitireducens TaxID=1324314 RepID=A0A1T2XKU9_9BACL|nr:Gfo/Idh/MocA family oxidoreductase [Paenibacillus selenitireducens]OPA80500.1 oxidoreductase [Paenibacillus selenitireducens]